MKVVLTSQANNFLNGLDILTYQAVREKLKAIKEGAELTESEYDRLYDLPRLEVVNHRFYVRYRRDYGNLLVTHMGNCCELDRNTQDIITTSNVPEPDLHYDYEGPFLAAFSSRGELREAFILPEKTAPRKTAPRKTVFPKTDGASRTYYVQIKIDGVSRAVFERTKVVAGSASSRQFYHGATMMIIKPSKSSARICNFNRLRVLRRLAR
jgi:hypothetical protein